MKILGQLENASVEQLSSDPGLNIQGRVFQNTTDGHTKLDTGVFKKSFLFNDEQTIIGLDATPANNVRIHRGAAGMFQDVLGDDVTVDGVSATVLAQRSARVENHLDSLLPSPGNIGRNVFVTDQNVFAVDDGTNWRKITPSYSIDNGSSGTNLAIPAVVSSVIRLTNASLVSVQTISAGFSAQEVTLVNRTGVSISIINNSGSPSANRILTGTGGNYILPNNAAVTLKYDLTTQSWQALIASLTLTAPATSAITTKTSNYTITPSDATIICDATAGAFSITLPVPADVAGQKFVIKKEDLAYANAVSIIGTIDGETDWKLWTPGETLEFHCDGTAYHKIRHITDTNWISAGSVVNFYLMTITTGAASAVATYTNNGNTYTVAKTIGAQQYTFTLSPAASATAGAVYSNNGKQFTVVNTVTGGTTLVTNGTGQPSASGVLTKVSGTGDAAINFSTSSTVLIMVGIADPVAGTLTKATGTGDATIPLLSFAGSAQLVTATTTIPVFNTAPVTNTWKWKRTGRLITMWINFYQSVAGVSNGNGDLLWPMVPGILADTTESPIFTAGPFQAANAGVALNTPNYIPNAGGVASYQATAYMQFSTAALFSTTKYRIFGTYNAAQLQSPGSVYIPAGAIIAYNFQVTFAVKDWKA